MQFLGRYRYVHREFDFHSEIIPWWVQSHPECSHRMIVSLLLPRRILPQLSPISHCLSFPFGNVCSVINKGKLRVFSSVPLLSASPLHSQWLLDKTRRNHSLRAGKIFVVSLGIWGGILCKPFGLQCMGGGRKKSWGRKGNRWHPELAQEGKGVCSRRPGWRFCQAGETEAALRGGGHSQKGRMSLSVRFSCFIL